MKLCQKCVETILAEVVVFKWGDEDKTVPNSDCEFWAHKLLNAIADNYHAIFDFDPEGNLIYHPKVIPA